MNSIWCFILEKHYFKWLSLLWIVMKQSRLLWSDLLKVSTVCPTDHLFLETSTLSFYDDFHIINGIPVFILDQEQDEKKWDKVVRYDSQSSCKVDYRELLYNPFSVTCCEFSDDGQLLISGHRNGLVRLWDTVHGKLIARVGRTHETQVAACAFKKGKEGQYTVLSCCLSGRLVQWDLNDLRDERRSPGYYDFRDNWNAESMKVDDALPSFSTDRNLVAFRLETKDNWFHDSKKGEIVYASPEDIKALGDPKIRRIPLERDKSLGHFAPQTHLHSLYLQNRTNWISSLHAIQSSVLHGK